MADHRSDAIPLESEMSAAATPGGADPRPRLPEPLPVRLVAVEHVRMPASRGSEAALDAFYVGFLGFDRYAGPGAGEGELVFRAENFLLRFHFIDGPPAHDSLRPQGIEVLDLAELEKKFIEAELEYERLRGTTPGRETLLLLDPVGNWVEIGEIRLIA